MTGAYGCRAVPGTRQSHVPPPYRAARVVTGQARGRETVTGHPSVWPSGSLGALNRSAKRSEPREPGSMVARATAPLTGRALARTRARREDDERAGRALEEPADLWPAELGSPGAAGAAAMVHDRVTYPSRIVALRTDTSACSRSLLPHGTRSDASSRTSTIGRQVAHTDERGSSFSALATVVRRSESSAVDPDFGGDMAPPWRSPRQPLVSWRLAGVERVPAPRRHRLAASATGVILVAAFGGQR